MIITSYVGIDEQVITIQRKEDLYPLLDWFQTKIMDLGATDAELKSVQEIIDIAEKKGFGNYDDVDNVEYN
jgi:hypothetical protein